MWHNKGLVKCSSGVRRTRHDDGTIYGKLLRSDYIRWTKAASQSFDTRHPPLVPSSPVKAKWSWVGAGLGSAPSPGRYSSLHLFIRPSSLWESLLTSCVWEGTLDISSLHMILSSPALGSAFPLPQPAVAAAAATDTAATAAAAGKFPVMGWLQLQADMTALEPNLSQWNSCLTSK